MGKVMSRINRQMYRFNAENRAHREIAKEKLRPAPRHPSTEKAMEEILKDTQHFKEQAMNKDSILDDYLKKVYVVSHDPASDKRKKPSEKGQLPLSRSPPTETELGYLEPSITPKGKITLRQAMTFLADNQGDKHLYNASRISSDYNLSKEDVDNILEYFGAFKVYIKEQPGALPVQDKVLNFFGSSNKVQTLPDKSET